MMYWIILIVLGALILVTIIVTIVTIVKERKEYKNDELDDYGDDDYDDGGYDDDYDDDYSDEEDEAEEDDRPVRKRKKPDAVKPQPAGGKKKRWKIILENTTTEERFDFIFYDIVGIGRTTKEVAFEQFLPIPDDRKISKVHCAIVRNKDKLYLRDEGSKNHTYLNGKRVQKPILIQKEDIISMGETDLEVIKVMREA